MVKLNTVFDKICSLIGQICDNTPMDLELLDDINTATKYLKFAVQVRNMFVVTSL